MVSEPAVGPSCCASNWSSVHTERLFWRPAAAQLYWDSPVNAVETQEHYNIITGIGFGGGSILFMLGALLLLARQVGRLFRLQILCCVIFLCGVDCGAPLCPAKHRIPAVTSLQRQL